MRACVYVYHQGDDYEKHSDLPRYVPPDFDRAVNWQNKMKNAREIRNSADYDPYPKTNSAWKKPAEFLRADAGLLIRVSREYLLSKGCKI
ncbi:MAG TPA: hypothetical protein VI756_32120 [Blastocatellia bacterium]